MRKVIDPISHNSIQKNPLEFTLVTLPQTLDITQLAPPAVIGIKINNVYDIRYICAIRKSLADVDIVEVFFVRAISQLVSTFSN